MFVCGAHAANIVSGFACTGICPFNSNIFNDTDFISQNIDEDIQKAVAIENDYDEDEQRRIYLADEMDINVSANETVSTSGASKSASTSVSRSSSILSLLSEIGPVKKSTPKKPSNRGPKPGTSTILTSPENVTALLEKKKQRDAIQAKKNANLEKRKNKEKNASGQKSKTKSKEKNSSDGKENATPNKAPAKKRKKTMLPSVDTSDSSDPECGACHVKFTQKPTLRNSYMCMGHNCTKLVHQTCVQLKYSVYTCSDCDSDDDLP